MKARRGWLAAAVTHSVLLLALSGQTVFASVKFQVGPNGVPNVSSGNRWEFGTGWGIDDSQVNDETLFDATFSLNAVLDLENFFLGPPASHTFTFGSIVFAEPNAGGGITVAETDNLDVKAYLTFLLPTSTVEVLNTAIVNVTQGSVSDDHTDLTISFLPVDVAFGANGLFTVELRTRGADILLPSPPSRFGGSHLSFG